jgi:Na+/H+ antiporter NhaC
MGTINRCCAGIIHFHLIITALFLLFLIFFVVFAAVVLNILGPSLLVFLLYATHLNFSLNLRFSLDLGFTLNFEFSGLKLNLFGAISSLIVWLLVGLGLVRWEFSRSSGFRIPGRLLE